MSRRRGPCVGTELGQARLCPEHQRCPSLGRWQQAWASHLRSGDGGGGGQVCEPHVRKGPTYAGKGPRHPVGPSRPNLEDCLPDAHTWLLRLKVIGVGFLSVWTRRGLWSTGNGWRRGRPVVVSGEGRMGDQVMADVKPVARRRGFTESHWLSPCRPAQGPC